MSNLYEIYIEAGEKKVFAVSTQWPGWCRFEKDEESAIQKLLEYGPRYEKIAKKGDLEFAMAESASDLKVIHRVAGNITTDFGAPAQIIAEDWDGIQNPELKRLKRVMKAAWEVFDEVVEAAGGNDLRKGPRGGGRDLDKIVTHVVEAEEAYLKKLGWKWKTVKGETMAQRTSRLRKEVMLGVDASAAGDIPSEGPRGGKRWPLRFFVRRLVWHVVDHAWEIEDRVIS